MKILKRSCETAFRSTALPRRRANGTHRTFSQTSSYQRGHLPSFHESSSPELATILGHLNSKILLPEHLNHEQSLLVFRNKYRSRVEAEPIYIQLGSVELPLEHIDITKDQQSRWSVIKRVAELSKEPRDWENVIKLLEGFHDASIKIRPQHLQKLVRKANEAGMQHLVLKALQKVYDTGLSLKEPMVLEFVLEGIHDKAAKAGWQDADTKKALSYAEQVVELMERREHLGREYVGRVGDPRTSPFVISVPLELAAVRAVRHLEGKDADGKVAKYALRLMTAFKQNDYMEEILPTLLKEQLSPEPPSKDSKAQSQTYNDIKKNIPKWLPIWNGLRTASAVLGAGMPMREEAQNIEGMVKQGLTSADRRLRELAPSGKSVDDLPCIASIRECEV